MDTEIKEKPKVNVKQQSRTDERERFIMYSNPISEEYEERMGMSGTKQITKIIRKRTFKNGVVKRRLVAMAKDDKEKAQIYEALKKAKKEKK